jgi:hypothetical protein
MTQPTILFLLAVAISAAAPDSFKLSDSQCRPATAAEIKWLAPSPELAPYARTCAIPGPGKRPALLLVTVSAERFYKHQPGTQADAVKLPAARVFFPDGRLAATLPYAFPDDPPIEMSVRFTEWRAAGLPAKIDIDITDPTATGNRRAALVWNAATKSYLQQEKNK